MNGPFDIDDGGPIVFEDKPIAFFDVDDTLVMWDQEQSGKAIKFSAGAYYVWCVPHERHIQMMKEFKARGFTIVVWSQGGSEWAHSVIRTLALDSIVDLIMPKPYWYFDDLHVTAWMTDDKRVYYPQAAEKQQQQDTISEVWADEGVAPEFLLDEEKGEL